MEIKKVRLDKHQQLHTKVNFKYVALRLESVPVLMNKDSD